MLHDPTGYTPYKGGHITGWPVTMISRGRVVIEESQLKAERGSNFPPCALSAMARPLGQATPELAFVAETSGRALV